MTLIFSNKVEQYFMQIGLISEESLTLRGRQPEEVSHRFLLNLAFSSNLTS